MKKSTKINKLTLKLFNSVVAQDSSELKNPNKSLKLGIYIPASAAYAEKQIINYIQDSQLSGIELNKTFHKSWNTIKTSTREELAIHQILHYMTTYGAQALGIKSDFVYIPNEVLEVPEDTKLCIRIIHALTSQQLIDKCITLLSSGVALDDETEDDLLTLLDLLKYTWTTIDLVKNHGIRAKLVDKIGIYPSNELDLLRYFVYKSTGSALIVKNDATIEQIKLKEVDITKGVSIVGYENCAKIFNRFKPIWLAFKVANKNNRSVVNKISRFSKKYHTPMKLDVLNTLTSVGTYSEKEIKEALANVNNFRKIRVLNALVTRANGAESFLYRIRNNKSYAAAAAAKKGNKFNKSLEKYIELIVDNLVEGLRDKLQELGNRVRYPEQVDYALPTTEKMFIGNFPTGTKITVDENMVAGIYWENSWGASDLDISGIALDKVGWDNVYKNGSTMYSGDLTDARKGAVEYLYVKGKELSNPTLLINNVYSGANDCKIRIIVGSAPKVKYNYTLKPDEKILEVDTNMFAKQQIVGAFIPRKKGTEFVLLNAGFGNMRVSSSSTVTENARNALFYQYANSIGLRELLERAGAELIWDDDKEADIDLRVQNLEKDSILKLFM